jgi:hypothetical protein
LSQIKHGTAFAIMRRVEHQHHATEPRNISAHSPANNAMRELICVIFATVADSFESAIVRSKFSVPLSPVYNSNGGVFMSSTKPIVDHMMGDAR